MLLLTKKTRQAGTTATDRSSGAPHRTLSPTLAVAIYFHSSVRAEFTRPIHRQRRGRMEGGDPNPARVDGKIFTRKKYVLISERSEFNEMIMKRRSRSNGGKEGLPTHPLHSAPPRTKMEKVCYRVNKSGRGKEREVRLDWIASEASERTRKNQMIESVGAE